MNTFGFATLAAGGLAAGFLGFAAPAQAAPSGPGNAQDTVSQLEGRGYRVAVNQQGAVGALDHADVVSVRYDNGDRRVYVTVR
ncbi:hypothetical protein [Mycolicibacterium baixiangningiae]|uniref:hypothetical protein n=1 Tax=Mycolicibacterium baixiangningiae TaxID=2761578 RepID=UPI001868B32E|nr:hypothetical protein [Mycolicibacterium baixiangningiae]